MTTRLSAIVTAVVLSLIAGAVAAGAEYQLQARADAVTNGDIVPGDHPVQDLTSSDNALTADVMTSLDIICWRDSGLQIHCERGATPSGTSIETVNSGNNSGNASAHVEVVPDANHPGFDLIKFKVKAGSSVSPTHGALIVSSSGNAAATYISRLHFTRLRDCAQSASLVSIFFSGHSTLQTSGVAHFCNNPFSTNCPGEDPSAAGSFNIAGPWLNSSFDVGPIATTFPLGAMDDRVLDYYQGAGSGDFRALSDSKADVDVFSAGPDGLRLQVSLNATSGTKGTLDENPASSFEAEATLDGFVFDSPLLDLPSDAISIADDAGHHFRVIHPSEVPFFADATVHAVCEEAGSGDMSGSGGNDNGASDNGAATTAPTVGSLCGIGSHLTLALTIVGFCAMPRFRSKPRSGKQRP